MLLENEPYPADVRVRNEAETLAAAGYRVTVIAPRADRRQPSCELIDGVEVVRFWLPSTPQSIGGFMLEYAVAHLQLARLALVRLLAGADALHVHNPPDTLGLLLVLARLLGRRTVFDNHDLFPELFAFRYGNPRLTRALRVFQRLAFRAADLVITTNQSQREMVVDAVSRDPESVVVVRNGPRAGVARDTSCPDDASRADDAACPDDASRADDASSPADTSRADDASRAAATEGRARAPVELVFVGALEPQDGVVTLAQVLSILVDRHRLDARLTVVGAGSSMQVLEHRCAQLGVSDRVVCTGRVAHEEVPRLLARADVCVDPAPCNELNHRSTMIKIAEYMAASKPIVAFDLCETKRTAGAAALYAACDDVDGFAERIARITASPQLASELTRQAEQRLPELLWDHSAEVLVTAYARLFS